MFHGTIRVLGLVGLGGLGCGLGLGISGLVNAAPDILYVSGLKRAKLPEQTAEQLGDLAKAAGLWKQTEGEELVSLCFSKDTDGSYLEARVLGKSKPNAMPRGATFVGLAEHYTVENGVLKEVKPGKSPDKSPGQSADGKE